ncbi:MAG TPA: hypothetical protein VJB92_03800 [Candidatus Paceibacterota bacterium]
MRNGQEKARMYNLALRLMKLVREGRRNPKEVADLLQFINDNRDFKSKILVFKPNRALSLRRIGTFPEHR